MKKLIPIVFILFIASCKKEEIAPELVREFSIQSITNGANYSIKVALPENYDAANHKYATLYVLDGEENFTFVTENCKKLSADYSTSNVLVVSIGYGNDRALDYTPTIVNESGGGSEKFMAFIENELIPKMESDFGADTLRKSRIILGHSYGGLFVAYAFAKHNNVFGNYIMLSPSLWYDNEVLFKMEQDNRNLNCTKAQLVFMGIGEMETEGRMQAPFEAFYQQLKNNYSNIKIFKQLQPHLGHVGSKNPNTIEGLKFYFKTR